MKRTGGATLATMVTWHGSRVAAEDEPPRPEIVTKLKLTVPEGGNWSQDTAPDGAPVNWLTILETSPMASGEEIDPWEVESTNPDPAQMLLINGILHYMGPVVIVFKREVVYP